MHFFILIDKKVCNNFCPDSWTCGTFRLDIDWKQWKSHLQTIDSSHMHAIADHKKEVWKEQKYTENL